MILPTIKNLIFDLGGVLLDLHFDRTYAAFARYANRTPMEIRAMIDSAPFFNQYEKGLMTDAEFRTALRGMVQRDVSDQEIDEAWNAMLGAIPAVRLELMRRLKSKYRIFLLSNTNNIHLIEFTKTVQKATGDPDLSSFFEVAHYSHVLKMRKPDAEIFEHVLKQHQLAPEATLFLDDNLANIQGAAAVGIQTFQVAHPDKMMSLFA